MVKMAKMAKAEVEYLVAKVDVEGLEAATDTDTEMEMPTATLTRQAAMWSIIPTKEVVEVVEVEVVAAVVEGIISPTQIKLVHAIFSMKDVEVEAVAAEMEEVMVAGVVEVVGVEVEVEEASENLH